MEENCWVVYIHTNKLDFKKYVGITGRVPEVRWNNGRGYPSNKYFTQAIKKYGWDGFYHDIICSGLSKDAAERIEILLIKILNTTDRMYGYNIDNGGSAPGRFTNETKQKMSQSAKHRPPQTEERRRKTSERMKGNQYAKGVHLSQERIAQLAAIHTGRIKSDEEIDKIRKAVSKPVVQLDADGNVLGMFPSATEAHNKTGVGATGIRSACNGKRNGSGGFLWMWKKNYDVYDGDFSEFVIVPWGSCLAKELAKK